MPGEEAQVYAYRDSLQALAVQYGKTTDELSAGLEGVLQSFNDTATAVQTLELATKTATATGSTSADALRLLAAVTKAYGDTTIETQKRVADLAQQTILLGDVQAGELASSIGRVTPLAKTLGITMEDLFGVFAAATGVTGGAAEVSTQYASVLRGLVDRGPQMNKAFKQAFGGEGIKTAEKAIGKYGLQEVLKRLAAQTDGTAEQLTTLFGRAEATTLALLLTGATSSKVAAQIKAVGGAAGAVDAAFAAQTKGLGAAAHQAAILAAQYQVLRQRVGDQVQGPMSELDRLMLSIGTTFASVFAPAFPHLANGFDALAISTENWLGPLEFVRDLLLTIMQVIDVVMTSFRSLGIIIAGVGASAAEVVLALAPGKGMTDRLAALPGRLSKVSELAGTDLNAGYAGLSTRFAARDALSRQTTKSLTAYQQGAMPTVRQSNGLEDLRNDASRIAGVMGSFFATKIGSSPGLVKALQVGAVNISVTVPAGTEAQAATRIADLGAREFFNSIMRGAMPSFPPAVP
jgi:TP901 family phage tail tape measure protein